ncbi:hypothetical protein [Tistrella mobilis]|jgi:hypothetical protein|uniref:hypothetical protein n=1 Tax=Tistrella mobilis TaxID=171437 RepID=UPI0005A20FD5|nr:hypothetical protein [Tistrella mobilis]
MSDGSTDKRGQTTPEEALEWCVGEAKRAEREREARAADRAIKNKIGAIQRLLDEMSQIDQAALRKIWEEQCDKHRDWLISVIGPQPLPGFKSLAHTYLTAFDDVARGKGQARHGIALDLMQQPVMQIGAMVGPGHCLGQVVKKVQEAALLHGQGENAVARVELLGAINYAAFAILLLGGMDDTSDIPF